MSEVKRLADLLRQSGHQQAGAILEKRRDLQSLCRIERDGDRHFRVRIQEYTLHTVTPSQLSWLASWLTKQAASGRSSSSTTARDNTDPWVIIDRALRTIGRADVADRLMKELKLRGGFRFTYAPRGINVFVDGRAFRVGDGAKGVRQFARFLDQWLEASGVESADQIVMYAREALSRQVPALGRSYWLGRSGLGRRIRQCVYERELRTLIKRAGLTGRPSRAQTDHLLSLVLERSGAQPNYFERLEELEKLETEAVLRALLLAIAVPARAVAEATIRLLVELRVLSSPISPEGERSALSLACALFKRIAVGQTIDPGIVDRLCQDVDLRKYQPLWLLKRVRSFAVATSGLQEAAQVIDRLLGVHLRQQARFASPAQPRSDEAIPNQESVRPAFSKQESPPSAQPASSWPSVLSTLGVRDPGVPDELARSLLEAALDRARYQRQYGLPEVEYWVQFRDPFLQGVGIERVRFLPSERPGELTVETAPTRFTCPLQVPPPTVRGGALFLALMAALAYCALVTSPDFLTLSSKRSGRHYQFPSRSPRVQAKGKRQPVALPRGRQGSVKSATSKTSVARLTAYVTPHLRKLRKGRYASADAVAAARLQGIRLPGGFTFVRGHIRGGEGTEVTASYVLVDLALETIRRFRDRKEGA